MNIHRTIRFLCIAFFMLTAGCATSSIKQNAPPPMASAHLPTSDHHGWWTIQFYMARPNGQTVWEKDLLIAHCIVAPILRSHQSQIELWRFHRRSANDRWGHRFRFLFFSSAATARQINAAVHNAPLMQRLLETNLVNSVTYASTDPNRRPDVGDTSDPKWSPVMKSNWPHFIMGVSRMWLGMIDQVSREAGNRNELVGKALLDHYRQVNKEVTRIWQNEGYHALLHHLNALYGYEAMVYWEKRWKTF